MYLPADQTVPWLLDRLAEDATAEDILVELECGYFNYLEPFRPPHGLYARLTREPAVFVHMVRTAYPENNDVDTPTSDSTTMQHMQDFLRRLRHIPGTRADGTIDQDALFHWATAARQLLTAAGCADDGDRCIGELISASPTDPDDGAWPHKAVRTLIETTDSDPFHDGLVAGTHNGIGVIGIYEGGRRERKRATQYLAWADQIVDDWPETGYVLREIAHSHQHGVGHLLDQSAQQRADEG
jgi:hypothetical protein